MSLLLANEKGAKAVVACNSTGPNDKNTSLAVLEGFAELTANLLGRPEVQAALASAFIEKTALTAVSSGDGEDLRAELERWRMVYEELSQKLSVFTNVWSDVLEACQKGLVSIFLSHGALCQHYRNDSPDEKRKIAEHVVESFFKNGLRCFVQASTAAIHLGEAIGKPGRVSCPSLIYTNSVVLPITVLREEGPHHVYTICGGMYDELCGGWLFTADDSEAAGHVRGLFKRAKDPLTTAFISPIATTVDEGIYFHRGDTTRLVQILLESAPHLVIMTPANRVYQSKPEKNDHPWSLAGRWREFRGRVSLVMGHNPAQSVLPFVELFGQKQLDVHWFDEVSHEWKSIESKPGERQVVLR
jgi:hypothetical protein